MVDCIYKGADMLKLYKEKGFTLIELMVTLTVTAIVLGIAIPSFNTQILNNRSIVLGEDFATALNFARSEAVKRGGRVSICASKDGATCEGEWKEGFIVFVDYATADNEVAPDLVNPDGGTDILRAWKKQDEQALITFKNGDDGDLTFMRFTGLGTLARVSDIDEVVIESELKNCKSNSARKITVRLSGMVGVERKACTTY